MNAPLAQQIIEDKLNGMSDKHIGNKYGINLKFIEKAITEQVGVNINNPAIKKTRVKIIEPMNFELEKNTVWSFKSRGNWATHNGNYRGNWSPYIPRNIILRYSDEEDVVLDYFCGSGTTAVECKLLNRNFIGVDINSSAIELTKLNLDFEKDNSLLFKSDISVNVGDARYLNIDEDSVDLICAHPPYSNIINYTANNSGDLSQLEVDKFLQEMDKVAKESFRVLKDDKYCVILMGDMRKNKNVIPLGFWVAEKFINNGFQLEELIIKRQHNCKTTGFWYKNSIKYNFLLLAHEYLLIFKKQKNISELNSNSGEDFIFNDYQKEINQIINKDINLESTTVWIFDNSKWYGETVSNLVSRFSNEGYLVLSKKTFDLNSFQTKKFDLIILPDVSHLADNLNNLSEILSENGILAIICEDRRLENGLIYSTAIKIEKLLRNENALKIKEIIILALNEEGAVSKDKFLNVSHKYILVYKKA